MSNSTITLNIFPVRTEWTAARAAGRLRAEVGLNRTLLRERAANERRNEWHLLSMHGRALVTIASDPNAGLEDIAARLGVEIDAAFGVVSDLVVARLVIRVHIGAQAQFVVNMDQARQQEITPGRTVAALLELFLDTEG